MLTKLFIALCLMGFCVAIHAGGVTSALRRLRRLILIAAWIVLLHLFEVSVWALFFFWRGAIADLPSALYFSAVTYSTTGYGDIVLPQDWRLAGGVEALTGILMCGWSTGFFVAVVSKLYESKARAAGA